MVYYKNIITQIIGDVSSLGELSSLASLEPQSSLVASPQPSASSTLPLDLDPDIRKDLVHQLKLNRDQIICRYANYVSCLCDCVKEKGVTVEHLRTYLLKLPAFTGCSDDKQENVLLSDVKNQLKDADTIHKIFDLIGEERTSFLNYDVFKFILEKYCSDVKHEDLKYPEHLKAYVDQHSIKEFFEINPSLEKCTASCKKLQFKLDIEPTCKIAKIIDLESAIASILGLRPSALHLIGVAEGCVVVTFLIPAFVADVLFPADKKMTAEEARRFEALSVLWIRCGAYREEIGSRDKQEQVKEMLICPICLDTVSVPKLLQCMHAYCQKCLELLVLEKEGKHCIVCPQCRQTTPLSIGGVTSLTPAYQLEYFLNLKEKASSSVDPDPIKKVIYCSIHSDQKVELYCKTCTQLICLNCADSRESGEHQNHSYEDIEVASTKYKEEITSLVESLERQVMTAKKALAEIGVRSRDISIQQDVIKGNIHHTFQELRVILNDRESRLLSDVDELAQKKTKDLAAQKDEIETILTQLDTCLFAMKESSRPGNEGEALLKRTHTLKQVEELTVPIKPDILKPSMEADMVFSALRDMKAICQDYGRVLTPNLPNPSKCHAKGRGLKIAAVGEKFTVLLQVINIGGKPCESPIALECEFESTLIGTTASCSIVEKELGQYEITYQPTTKGRHQLHITIEGQHIEGSPFNVSVRSPVEKLGAPILTIREEIAFRGPNAVAINQKGEMVVTGDSVSVFDLNGKKIQSFGLLGSQYLSGVAVDSDGSILVVDHGHNVIRKLTSGGQLLTEVTNFSFPRDIAINPYNSKIYVVDSNGVQILNPDLSISGLFHKAQFIHPWGISCDSTGKVYVADVCDNHIKVFTPEGALLRTFGGRGQGIGQLHHPTYVVVDASDLVYVSEHRNFRVSVFTSEGEFVTSFGKMGEGPGEFNSPRGLAVDSNGIVYVCDSQNKCIQAF